MLLMDYIVKYMLLPGQIENINIIFQLNNMKLSEDSNEVYLLDLIANNYPLRVNVIFLELETELVYKLKTKSNLKGIDFYSFDKLKELINPEQLEEKFGGSADSLDSNVNFIPFNASKNFKVVTNVETNNTILDPNKSFNKLVDSVNIDDDSRILDKNMSNIRDSKLKSTEDNKIKSDEAKGKEDNILREDNYDHSIEIDRMLKDENKTSIHKPKLIHSLKDLDGELDNDDKNLDLEMKSLDNSAISDENKKVMEESIKDSINNGVDLAGAIADVSNNKKGSMLKDNDLIKEEEFDDNSDRYGIIILIYINY